MIEEIQMEYFDLSLSPLPHHTIPPHEEEFILWSKHKKEGLATPHCTTPLSEEETTAS